MLIAVAQQAAAQEPRLSISPGTAENGWRAAVRPVDLFADSALIRPLASGLPLRFNFRLELWHDRFLADGLVSRVTWGLILYQEPLSGDYSLTRSWDPQRVEWFRDIRDATEAIERWYQSPLIGPAPESGGYYYEAGLEIEILSLGDLAELEHWLRGEVADQDGDLGGALTRGLKRLFIRLIGLSARRYSARTDLFRP